MNLIDELFKLKIACSDPLFVRYRHHAVQLRIIAKARHQWSPMACSNAKDQLDRLVCKHYID